MGFWDSSNFYWGVAFLCLIGLVLMINLNGINNRTVVNLENSSYNFTMLDQYYLNSSSGNPNDTFVGVHEPDTNRIWVATDNRSIWEFISTCSHEVQHLKYDLNNDLTTEEQHQRMEGLNDTIWPWNWHTECIKLVPQRLKL